MIPIRNRYLHDHATDDLYYTISLRYSMVQVYPCSITGNVLRDESVIHLPLPLPDTYTQHTSWPPTPPGRKPTLTAKLPKPHKPKPLHHQPHTHIPLQALDSDLDY
jgi:hypothetical protein